MPRSADVLTRFCRTLASPALAGLSDRELLERFAAQRDEAAFAVLLDRHGPLVHGVCRRVLHDDHLADDVFQAVFLVLARKAGSIRRSEMLANWLFGVALRLAKNARQKEARRRRLERGSPVTVPSDQSISNDLLTILDEELQRLPADCRAPLLACYHGGRTQDEAARELGWSVRTLRRRLERGRELLRLRMARRGA
ncbi:MAG TPA: RNA polymerase sigma factor, partial [Gemmataceae bacterium]|nr:RNA polymerase sigma factor [Gemmataceae bacterium]